MLSNGGGESTTASRAPRMFVCSVCCFSSPYVYYGRNPKMAPKVVFLEDCFIANDPFTPDLRPLCLGSKCSICSACVCINCSVFYTKRLCGRCAKGIQEHLPAEIRGVVDRLPAPG